VRAHSLRAKVRDVCLPKLNTKITLSIDAMCLPYKYYSSLRSHISFHVKPSPNIKQLSSAKCLSGLNMHLSALTLYSTSNFSLAKQLLTKPFPALKLVSRLLVVSVDL